MLVVRAGESEIVNLADTRRFRGLWFRWERRQVIQIFRVNDYIRVTTALSSLVENDDWNTECHVMGQGYQSQA